MTRDKPPASEAPFLRGEISHFETADGKRLLNVSFGMNEYCIPLEAHDPSVWDPDESKHHVMSIRARVGSNGRALIEDLLVDGKPFAQWNAEQ